jgi:hypothetical protein
VYRERQPSLTHVAALAAFTDQRFAASNFAIAGQQPVQVSPAYNRYYDLQNSFGVSTCAPAEYQKQADKIRELATSGPQPPPPVYFLLIRPPETNSLDSVGPKLASGTNFELYRLTKR